MYITHNPFVATDPEAREMEARMRFPGYTVVRSLNGVGKRWHIRRHSDESRRADNYVRRTYGDVCGPMNGYATELRAWQVVATWHITVRQP